MQNDGAPTQNDAPESHAPKPDGAHSFVCCSALFCLRAVIRCAMKLLPCKILGDARKSRQHAVFERCPNDARPDGSRPAKSTWPKPLAVQRHAGLTYTVQPSASHCQCTRSCPTIRSCAGPALPSMLPRAPRCASQAPYTACAYCEAGPPREKKSDGAEPGFEPGTLRLLAVRSNH